MDDLGSLPQTQLHSVVQSLAPEPPIGTPQHGIVPAPNLLPPEQPQSDTPEDRKHRSPISDEALIIARKTFQSVEIGSRAIPVVGNYVGAVAKIGLAFVEILQVYDID